jgi:hypothetical protein
MEKVGLKGVTKAINKKLTGETLKKASSLIGEFNKEGATEWIQVGLEEYNKSVGGGSSLTEAAEKAASAMFSEQGLEAYVMGVAGSGGASVLGRTVKAPFKKNDIEKLQELDENDDQAIDEFLQQEIDEGRIEYEDAQAEKEDLIADIKAAKKMKGGKIPEGKEGEVHDLIKEKNKITEQKEDADEIIAETLDSELSDIDIKLKKALNIELSEDEKIIEAAKKPAKEEAPKREETEPTVAEEPTERVEPRVEEFKNKTTEDLEKRQFEIQDSKDDTERDEFNKIDKELEKREWDSVMNADLNEVKSVLDELKKKESEMPNGFGSYIEKSDIRESREVVDRYSEESKSKLSNEEVKKDFIDAMRGNPTTWYADGLKLREAVKEASRRGITFESLLEDGIKVYTKDGYDRQTAEDVVKGMIQPIFKPKEDAIQKREAEAVDVQEQAKPSEELVEEVKEEPTKEKPKAQEEVTEQPTEQPTKKGIEEDIKVSDEKIKSSKETVSKAKEKIKSLEKGLKSLFKSEKQKKKIKEEIRKQKSDIKKAEDEAKHENEWNEFLKKPKPEPTEQVSKDEFFLGFGGYMVKGEGILGKRHKHGRADARQEYQNKYGTFFSERKGENGEKIFTVTQTTYDHVGRSSYYEIDMLFPKDSPRTMEDVKGSLEKLNQEYLDKYEDGNTSMKKPGGILSEGDLKDVANELKESLPTQEETTTETKKEPTKEEPKAKEEVTPKAEKKPSTKEIEAKKKQTSPSSFSVVSIKGNDNLGDKPGGMVQQDTDGISNYGGKYDGTIIELKPKNLSEEEKGRRNVTLFKGRSGNYYLISRYPGVFGNGRTEALALPFQIGKDISGLNMSKVVRAYGNRIDSILRKELKPSISSEGTVRYEINSVSEKGEQIGNQLKKWWDSYIESEVSAKEAEPKAKEEVKKEPTKEKPKAKEEVAEKTDEEVLVDSIEQAIDDISKGNILKRQAQESCY